MEDILKIQEDLFEKLVNGTITDEEMAMWESIGKSDEYKKRSKEREQNTQDMLNILDRKESKTSEDARAANEGKTTTEKNTTEGTTRKPDFNIPSVLYPEKNLGLNTVFDGKLVKNPNIRVDPRPDAEERNQPRPDLVQNNRWMDNPFSIDNGVMSPVQLPTVMPEPTLPDNPTPEDREKHAELIEARNAQIKARSEAENNARAEFGMADRVAEGVRGFQPGERTTRSSKGGGFDRGAYERANENRKTMNRFNDLRKNDFLMNAVGNWAMDQKGDDMGGMSWNDYAAQNPMQAMKWVEEFKQKSAADAVRRHDFNNPKYTEADVQAYKDNNKWEHASVRKDRGPGFELRQLSPDQAEGNRDRLGLPTLNTGASPITYARRDSNGILLAPDGGVHPDNPFAYMGPKMNKMQDQHRIAEQKSAQRDRQLGSIPTPRSDRAMAQFDNLSPNDQLSVVNSFRTHRGEAPIGGFQPSFNVPKPIMTEEQLKQPGTHHPTFITPESFGPEDEEERRRKQSIFG